MTRRMPPPRGEELHGLEQAVARSLAPHAPRLRRVVVSVEGSQMLCLRADVVHEHGSMQVEHLDPGSLADATPHFADRMQRAVARVLALGLHRADSRGARDDGGRRR